MWNSDACPCSMKPSPMGTIGSYQRSLLKPYINRDQSKLERLCLNAYIWRKHLQIKLISILWNHREFRWPLDHSRHTPPRVPTLSGACTLQTVNTVNTVNNLHCHDTLGHVAAVTCHHVSRTFCSTGAERGYWRSIFASERYLVIVWQVQVRFRQHCQSSKCKFWEFWK